MMNSHRRSLLAALAAAGIAAPLRGFTQSGKTPVVGLMWLKSDFTEQVLVAFRESLREGGFVEGKNVRFERRDQVASYSQLPEAATELVQLRVDVILAWGDTATQAARKATSTIPIVMIQASDPEKVGLAASLARPGGNVTGLTAFGQDVMGKRLEILREAVPRARKVAVLMNPDSAGQRESFNRAEVAAQALGLQAQLIEVRDLREIESAFSSAVDAVIIVPSTMFRAHRLRLAELASAHKLPAVFSDQSYVEAGGLMAYGADPRDFLSVAARHVARILKGARPAEMPIERIHRLHLSVNLKAAKTIGMTLPQSLVARADRVIE
jgi:putative ABC transport system substrate-binding protein